VGDFGGFGGSSWELLGDLEPMGFDGVSGSSWRSLRRWDSRDAMILGGG
jgi:hypothetical protein